MTDSAAPRLFLDERNLKALGFTEPNVRTMRELTKFLNVQNRLSDAETVIAPLDELTTAGLLVRTGENAYTTRAVTGTADQIEVTNGDGVAGDPTLNLADTAVTPGTYGDATHVVQLTVDQQGRITNAQEVALDISGAIVEGDGITVTDNGDGTVTISAAGGTAGSGSFVAVMDGNLGLAGDAFASLGQYCKFPVALTITGMSMMLNAVSGRTYTLNYAPYSTATSKITAAPTIVGTFTPSVSEGFRVVAFDLASPLSVSAGQTYAFWISLTSATTTTTPDCYWADATINAPHFAIPTSNGIMMASKAPTTATAWFGNAAVYSINLFYSV